MGFYMRPSISPAVLGLLQSGALGEQINILEIGCGTGIDAVTMARLGHLVTGVDCDGRYVAAAKRRARKSRVAARTDFHTCTFPNESAERLDSRAFDLVVDTLCLTNLHDVDDREYAREVWRVLRKSGGRHRRGRFVLHFRPFSAEEPETTTARKRLHQAFGDYFEWTPLVKTHLAEERKWNIRDVCEDVREDPDYTPRLHYDWAMVYVGIGTARPRPKRA